MRDLIKRLAGRIYAHYGGDLGELTRKANRLLTSDATEPPITAREERIGWLGRMVTVESSKELEWLMADISEAQKKLSFEEARGAHDLEWGRATMNGLMLLRQRLQVYRAEFDEINRKPEPFNPHDPI